MFDGSQVKKLVALAEVWCMAVRRHGGVVSGLLFVFLVSWRRMIVPLPSFCSALCSPIAVATLSKRKSPLTGIELRIVLQLTLKVSVVRRPPARKV